MAYQANNRQLLCTFTTDKEFKKVAENIKKFYSVYNNKIFVFSNLKNPSELYLTYNVLDMRRNSSRFPNTILIHRKKHTNTLYTLNAMNRLIEEESGKFDEKYVVNWEFYKNSLIITGEISVRIISLKIFEVIE